MEAADISAPLPSPPHPASTPEDEQEGKHDTAADASSTSMILCRASSETLGHIPFPLSGTTSITTPALVTLAWQALQQEHDVIRLMRARADARHFIQESSVLHRHRLLLQAEWEQLWKGRVALQERIQELSLEDFIALQLELLRLEKAAASRAYEMSRRAQRLRDLHGQLKDTLTGKDVEVPALALLEPPSLSAAADAEGEQRGHRIPIEEKVLVDMDRGVRGVPVSVVHPDEKKDAEEKKKGRSWWRWWPSWGRGR